MKKLIFILALFIAPTAYAGNTSIHVDWGYICPSSVSVTGFRLYQGDTPVWMWEGEDIRSGDAYVDILREETKYTLVAVFEDGTESPHSVVYPLTNEPDDKPRILEVTTKVTTEIEHTVTLVR